MQAFCEEHRIDYELCGKVIVATDVSEVGRLKNIYERGQKNGVHCEMIGAERLQELEPHVQGVQAIHVPESGIVNYRQVCQVLADQLVNRGHALRTSTRVLGLQTTAGEVVVRTNQGDFTTQRVVNCAGLYSDKVAQMSAARPEAKIVPFRGEYFELRPEVKHLCRNLVYPVPDPSFPFLGVHFTRMIDGSVECGPNAVLALAREGYRWSDIHWGELAESLTYPGFLRLAAKYWRVGAGEVWRSLSKRAFVRALQKLIPEIREEHLIAAPAGVRAQAIRPNGEMVDDFLIVPSDRVLHVCNAPSPAATSSLNIGQWIVQEAQRRNGSL